jgi:hypothetical protein
MRVVMVAGLMAAGGVGHAQIPASDGAIHACYHAKKGRLRVVEATAACRKSERPLTWSQQGPQGAGGASGPPGPTASSVASFQHPGVPTYAMIGTSDTLLMTLDSGTATGPITTTFAGRITAIASITINPSTVPTFCRLKIAPAGSSTFVEMSQYTSTTGASVVQVPIVGAVDRPPGTYDVGIFCVHNSPGSPVFLSGDLVVVAAGS